MRRTPTEDQPEDLTPPRARRNNQGDTAGTATTALANTTARQLKATLSPK
ncbi:MAG TPA: hypothetical protein VLK65_06445 [Vicinamibacteria bacterium]|nr:hypothetical protein [Vicinamibacteria bacterium]